MHRGFFGIGVSGAKFACNVGTLMRSAHVLGASFVFTVGKRYRREKSDTVDATRHTPLFHHDSIESLGQHMPHGASLVGVELCDHAVDLVEFKHPQQAVYLLGAEDSGLGGEGLAACDHVVRIPGTYSVNVAVAGSIVLYDRLAKS